MVRKQGVGSGGPAFLPLTGRRILLHASTACGARTGGTGACYPPAAYERSTGIGRVGSNGVVQPVLSKPAVFPGCGDDDPAIHSPSANGEGCRITAQRAMQRDRSGDGGWV